MRLLIVILIGMVSFVFIFIFMRTKGDNSIVCPMFLFPIIWFLVAFLSNLRLYDIVEVSDKIYWMIFLGVLFFELGALIANNYKIKQFDLKPCNEKKFGKNILFLQIIATVIFVIADIQVLNLLSVGYSLADIYVMRLNMANGGITELSNGLGVIEIFVEYLARPILAISIPYSCIALVKYKDKKNMFFTIALLILSFINKVNRFDVFMMFVTLVCAIIISGRKIVLTDKHKIAIVCAIVIGVVSFVYMSQLRGGTTSLGKTVYMYLCGNIPFANIKIQELGNNYEHTIIFTSLQGFFRFFNQIIEVIGFENQELYLIAERYSNVEDAVNIGGNYMYNAFVGIFYFFYCDLGWFGICVFSFIFGYFAEMLYVISAKKDNVYLSTLFLMVLVRGVVFSFINFMFVGITYAMALPMLFIVAMISKGEKSYDLY